LKYTTDFPVIINLPQRFTATISAKHCCHVFSAVSHNIRIAGARGHVHSFAMNIYSGDVVSKVVLSSFHNLLQSGDGISAKKLVEDFDIQYGDPSIVLTERKRKYRFEYRAKNQTAVFSRVHLISSPKGRDKRRYKVDLKHLAVARDCVYGRHLIRSLWFFSGSCINNQRVCI